MKKIAWIISLLIFLILVFGVMTAKNAVTSTKLTYNCQPGKTVFERLTETHLVEAQDGTYGKFVVSIDGLKQGNSKYWLYTINAQEASISASQYKCQSNEKINWELK